MGGGEKGAGRGRGKKEVGDGEKECFGSSLLLFKVLKHVVEFESVLKMWEDQLIKVC